MVLQFLGVEDGAIFKFFTDEEGARTPGRDWDRLRVKAQTLMGFVSKTMRLVKVFATCNDTVTRRILCGLEPTSV